VSTLGVIGCILGFLIVIYLCYKDWSVYLATFAGACVVIACNTLPFIDSLVGDYVSGMFTAVKSFFFMILFGCLQSKIYTESGAAYTIADTVMNRLLKENMSNTGKNLIGMSVILVIGTILNLGGIIAGVVIVLMYPIALVIFERCDIPKKFILGILGAGSFTFTLTVPGSPQVTNVAAMTVLGTAADVALVPGLVGAAAEIAAILVIMNLLINRARKRGEHFELHPLDPRYDSTGSKPKLIVALIPMAVLFLLFNIWKLNINICLLCSIALSLVLFWPQLRRRDLKAMLNSGAVDSVPMTMTVAAICGFAGVITNTDAFQSMITAITSISIAPILICWVVVALMCMLTGGSSTAARRAADHRAEAAGARSDGQHHPPRVRVCGHHARLHALFGQHPHAAAHVPHEAQGGLPRPVRDDRHRHDRRYRRRHAHVRPVPGSRLSPVNPHHITTERKSRHERIQEQSCRHHRLRHRHRPRLR